MFASRLFSFQELDLSRWLPSLDALISADSGGGASSVGSRRSIGSKRKSTAGGSSKATIAELQAKQQAKFQQAKEKMEKAIKEKMELERRQRQMMIGAQAVATLLESEETPSKKQRTEEEQPSTFGAL